MMRRVGFLFICSAAIPIAVFAATAWACGALMTIKADPSAAAPGQTISVTARNFAAVNRGGGPWGPVQIRWGSRTGPLLKELTPPASTGPYSFTDTVQVPAGTPAGWHVVFATQHQAATGIVKSGAPARTTVRVQGAGAGSSTTPWGAAKPTSGGPGSPDVPLPGILLSVALLATGLTLVIRGKGKKATRPVLGV